jgi:indolepyruvate ferredoxin oxidoreductase
MSTKSRGFTPIHVPRSRAVDIRRRKTALTNFTWRRAAAPRNPVTGEPKKMSFGPWILKLFAALAKFKFLRGTAFDPFGYTAERKTERRLIADYEKLLAEFVERLTPDNHQLAVGLAMIPEKIRGYGPVKQRHLAAAKAEEATLLEQFRAGATSFLRAAE